MVELAVPMLALGSMYIISNFKSTKENLTNMSKSNKSLVDQLPMNYPVATQLPINSVKKYVNPNQITDKYYTNQTSEYVERNNPPNSVGGSVGTVLGLDGKPINKDNFKHNNQVPFFGAKIKGSRANLNQAESILDNMQGTGSQYLRKKEQAPLFKPQSQMTWANGMPNMTEFLLSRQNPSTKMNNVKPWDEEKVAPGLGLGYTTAGSGSGYNAGSENRNAWLPKTVDERRVATNPKITFGLKGHEGPADSYIKDYGHTKTLGKIEKNRPDTDYTIGPERWFTTTGIEKGQTSRGIELLHHVNRPETTQSYFGGMGNDGRDNKSYTSGKYRPTHKQQLAGPDYNAATSSGKYSATTGDYGNGSYENLCNNRATVKQPNSFGGVDGIIKAMIAPVLDILRPTRKENMVDNLRQNGNINITNKNGRIYNPGDRTKTTIREQTEGLLDNTHLNFEGQAENAYLVSDHQGIAQERDTTSVSYNGMAAPATMSALKNYDAEYNQRNNVNKTHKNRPNHGVSSLFNHEKNIQIAKKESDRVNNRNYSSSVRIPSIPSSVTFGNTNMPQYKNESQNCERMNPEMLVAFKKNPYTQSLNSWA